MSTAAYRRIAAEISKHKESLAELDTMLDTIEKHPQPTTKYQRQDRRATAASVGKQAAAHLHAIETLQRASSSLSPESLAVFADAIEHGGVDKAIAALPSEHRFGPTGDLVRQLKATPGPLGHQLASDTMQHQLDEILDKVVAGGKDPDATGSGAAGSGGKNTGRQDDGGVQSQRGSVPELSLAHEEPAAKKGMSFREASDALREAFSTGDKGSK